MHETTPSEAVAMVLQDYIYCRQIIYGILWVFTYNRLKRKVNFIWSFAI